MRDNVNNRNDGAELSRLVTFTHKYMNIKPTIRNLHENLLPARASRIGALALPPSEVSQRAPVHAYVASRHPVRRSDRKSRR